MMMRNIEDYVAIRVAIFLGILILICIAMGSCVTGVPEQDDLRAQQVEQERKELFVLWKRMCLEAGGYILIDKAWTCQATKPDCIPHRLEWDAKIIDIPNGKRRLISKSMTYQCARRP